jgi:hypothetical protein
MDKIVKYSVNLLTLSCVLYFLLTIPSYWIAYPDSGYYLGTAESLITYSQYWFNGLPNLLYYPGVTTLLLIPTFLGENNYWFLQAFVTLITLSSLFFILKIFPIHKYGILGSLTVLLLCFSSIFTLSIHPILSDGIFLTSVFSTLYCCFLFERTGKYKLLYLAACLAAIAAMIRFQGLFLCGAVVLAGMWFEFEKNKTNFRRVIYLGTLVAFIALTPFIIWTIRNYYYFTPDAFNMASQKFFGLNGMSLYAPGLPGNVNSDWVNADWKYKIYRPTYFFGELVDSFIGQVSLSTKLLLTPILGLFFLTGLPKWIAKASKVEIVFIALSVGFILQDLLLQNSLYVLARYWLPILPHYLLISSLGILFLYERIKTNKFSKHAFQALSVVLFLSFTIASLQNFTHFRKSESIYKNIGLTLEQLAEFTEKNIPSDAVVGTNDWGVLPRTINRRSVPILNDVNHARTMLRLMKYSTTYLVLLNKFDRSGKPALEMVAKFPNIFDKIYAIDSSHAYADASVYKIDQELLLAQVKSMSASSQ